MPDFFTASGAPSYRSGPTGTSAAMRAEFTAIQTAMAKLAGYTGNGSKFLRVNAVGTAYEALSVADALAALAPNSAALATALTDTTGTGVFVRTQAPTLTSATLVTPALGTPASGVATNLTGTAAGLTAGNVTTNANLTGHITSVGNAAVLGSFTKAQLDTAISDGNAVYVNDTPALVGTNFTGTAASLTVGTATNATNATNQSGGTVNATSITASASAIGTPSALTSSGSSIAINLASACNFTHTTTENTTLAAPSNPVAGQSGIIVITQGATARTLGYNSFWKFAGGTVPTLTATIGAVDTFAYYVESGSRATCSLIGDVK